MKYLSKILLILLGYVVFTPQVQGQFFWDKSAQNITLINYGPTNNHAVFAGNQLIASIDPGYRIDSLQKIDGQISVLASVNGQYDFSPNFQYDANLLLYRGWIRYTSAQLELTAGLQKIDFGSASILRPLQWFNQIDPRDPLGLTQGVNAIVGKYVFLDNSNIWLWGLYSNEGQRGLDFFPSDGGLEFGGRYQIPVPKGEIGLTYHQRNIDPSRLGLAFMESSTENKVALDGKWDLGIGLWSEISYAFVHDERIPYRHNTLINLGMDYTFGIGNGINIILEHLIYHIDDEKIFSLERNTHISALIASYPLGFFDNINAIFYYPWATDQPITMISYQHDFKAFTSYVMAYYNPDFIAGISGNELTYNFSGPGIRFMFVKHL